MATQMRPLRGSGLAERYQAVRALSRAIAAPLSEAEATLQPMPDASPAKWHLAHTCWFFETFVLRDYVPGYQLFDESWAFLFNSYYEGEGDRLPRAQRGLIVRPSVAQVLDYRDHVDAAILAALPALPEEALRRLELGLQHEQQHQELQLMDMLAASAANPIAAGIWPQAKAPPSLPPPALGTVQRPGGVAEIGHGGAGFAFDCETPRHRVLLHPHELADRLVTNGEWLRFIDEGGYSTPAYWLADGWDWVKREGVEAPLYWRRRDGHWLSFGLDGLAEIDPAEPVCHISYYEADAFARWAGARLPTEAEWEVAASGLDPSGGNQLDEAGPVRPRAALPGPGAKQMFGDVWEWTMSAYLPYPGFRPEQGAVGEYNGKFMVNQFVLKGGSCATPRGHVRASYRNFFYPHQRWQFSGLRLARDA
jgi:ergothioneine biosynthesis protein EgtB